MIILANDTGISQETIDAYKSALMSLKKNLSERMAAIAPQIGDALNVWKKVLLELRPLVVNFEKNYASYCLSCEQWGKYGWSFISDMPIYVFYEAPNNELEADKICLSYINKTFMHELFLKLQREKISRDFLEEAIFCYENKKYTACASLLFSLIDAELISCKFNGTNKKVGKAAADKIDRALKDVRNPNRGMVELLFWSNLNGLISEYFASANNFTNEGKKINRNFLLHGMTKHKVLKKDCIKLFIFLDNMTQFNKN